MTGPGNTAERQNQSLSSEVLAIRESFERNTSAAGSALPWPAGMQESQHWFALPDGTKLEVRRFLPKSVADQQPADATLQRAVVFFFGGGFVAGSIDVFCAFMATFAELSRTQVFAPHWRTAPEHPFPTGTEDAYAAVQWLQSSAGEFDVDPSRIVVTGMSAGATIAAAVSLMARDRGLEPGIAAQVLRYPALDDQADEEPGSERGQMLARAVEINDLCWKTYLGGLEKGERTDANTPCYAAPARAKDVSRLPPAHIGVGDYDLFRDECQLYAQRLEEAGVSVEFFNYPESPHGFDGMPGSVQGTIMWDREAAFVKRF